jgi:NAD-dependent DNA ligase
MMDDYFKYTIKSRLDKAINTLLGILEGIAADRTVSIQEWNLLGKWAAENQEFADRHPYNELIPRLVEAMSDGVLSEEEHQNMVWLCNKLLSTDYYDRVTADIQTLQGILGAIASDGVVAEAEAEKLLEWIQEREHLRKCWPYDEVESIVINAMKDHWIDTDEQKMLLEYFSSFTPSDFNFSKPVPTSNSLPGVCAIAPEILFDGQCFCFTGESVRTSREEMKIIAIDRGARVVESISPRVNYLVVGSNGNPCWAYACYGRKIEKAMQLRQKGARIVIVHEVDFFDTIS